MPISEVFNMDCMFNSNYVIYNDGRVFSKKNNIFLRPQLQKNGYLNVSFYTAGNKKTYNIHLLVATHFIQNKTPLLCVNHKDGNKLNNKVENLEWLTHSGNLIHAYKNKLNKRLRPVNCYDLNGNFLKQYDSARSADKDGFNNQNIAKCCNGLRKTHKNKIWKYAD